MVQSHDARHMPLPARGLECRERHRLARRRPRGAAAQPVEQGVDARVATRRREQRHHLRGGAGRREFPAGFVKQADVLAVEQGADAPHQHAVLRDQGDGLFAAAQVFEHGGGSARSFVFEALANHNGRCTGAVDQAEGFVIGRVGTDHENWREGIVLQAGAERVRATGLHHDPRRRPQREQTIGGRWWRHAGPFERHPRQQPRTRARPRQRRQKLARARPMR